MHLGTIVANHRVAIVANCAVYPFSMIIAQISDTHLIVRDADKPGAAKRRIADFENTVAAINELVKQPDIVIHTGDIAQNASHEEYELALEILSRLKAPFLVALGNRDLRPQFLDVFGHLDYLKRGSEFIQYAVDFSGIRLIAGDSLSGEASRGRLCDRRISVLKGMISSGKEKPTYVFLHHPPDKFPIPI